jgi:hypothetical protein
LLPSLPSPNPPPAALVPRPRCGWVCLAVPSPSEGVWAHNSNAATSFTLCPHPHPSPPSPTGDLDDVFAYKTVRTVRIRDRWLGVLFYTLQLAIAAYVIAYQVIVKQQYLKEYDVVGSARLQLLQPSMRESRRGSRMQEEEEEEEDGG